MRERLLEADDMLGAATWRRILKAIKALRRSREPGESVN